MTLAGESKERRFVTELTFAATGDAGRISDPRDAALDHFGCWPEWEASSLRGNADTTRETVLKVGDDFDMVIVATGFEGFSSLVRSLDENEEGLEVPVPRAWTSAASTGRTVGTRAAQVWLTRISRRSDGSADPGSFPRWGSTTTPGPT